MSEPTTEFRIEDWGLLFPGGDYGLYSGTYAVYDTANRWEEGARVEDVTPARIARIDAARVEHSDFAETAVTLLVELTDGTWAACMAGCDTTGWDCQAGVQWKWAHTRDDVIRQGLDRASRAALGLALDDEAADR